MIGLGLTGVAHDERRAERAGRLRSSDSGDPLQEPLATTPASHPPEMARRGVLEREVEVGHPGRQDGLDEPLGEA